MIQISASVAVTLVIAFLGLVFAFGKILLGQFEKRMDERLQATDKVIVEESRRITGLTTKVDNLMQLLPLEYVRREDWIRFSAQIDTKLDRLAELVLDRNHQGGGRARN